MWFTDNLHHYCWVYFLNGHIVGLTSGDRHLVTLPILPYAREQNILMSLCWHLDVTMVIPFSPPLEMVWGTRKPPTIHYPWQCLHTIPQLCFSQQNVLCPPIVVLIMSMWRSQNCSMRKNIFVVILSLPIISLSKTDLPPDIQADSCNLDNLLLFSLSLSL